MIKPEDFYTSNELPDKKSTHAMWRSVRRSSSRDRSEPMLVNDRRSFLYGMAATVLLGLALDGAWTTAYGSDGTTSGGNYTLELAADATVTFTYDPTTHLVTVTTE